jgi:hypothetical protein
MEAHTETPRDAIRRITEQAAADIAAVIERERGGMTPPPAAGRASALVRTKLDEARLWAGEALP